MGLDLPSAPNGTSMDHNITLCRPGTFQPQSGRSGTCLRCPIGFMCPLFGLSMPMLCPGGAICERLSLVVPSSLCINGHYCNKGTKMSSQIAQSTTETEGGATAEKFCTSCGCGDDPTGVPTGVPTPSPPDDECKGGKDEIDLENKGTRTCKKIEEKKWCDEKVVGGGKAKKFCTSCGCGDDPTGFPTPSPPVDPTGVPTPSPPDDECKGGKDEIDLENKGT